MRAGIVLGQAFQERFDKAKDAVIKIVLACSHSSKVQENEAILQKQFSSSNLNLILEKLQSRTLLNREVEFWNGEYQGEKSEQSPQIAERLLIVFYTLLLAKMSLPTEDTSLDEAIDYVETILLGLPKCISTWFVGATLFNLTMFVLNAHLSQLNTKISELCTLNLTILPLPLQAYSEFFTGIDILPQKLKNVPGGGNLASMIGIKNKEWSKLKDKIAAKIQELSKGIVEETPAFSSIQDSNGSNEEESILNDTMFDDPNGLTQDQSSAKLFYMFFHYLLQTNKFSDFCNSLKRTLVHERSMDSISNLMQSLLNEEEKQQAYLEFQKIMFDSVPSGNDFDPDLFYELDEDFQSREEIFYKLFQDALSFNQFPDLCDFLKNLRETSVEGVKIQIAKFMQPNSVKIPQSSSNLLEESREGDRVTSPTDPNSISVESMLLLQLQTERSLPIENSQSELQPTLEGINPESNLEHRAMDISTADPRSLAHDLPPAELVSVLQVEGTPVAEQGRISEISPPETQPSSEDADAKKDQNFFDKLIQSLFLPSFSKLFSKVKNISRQSSISIQDRVEVCADIISYFEDLKKDSSDTERNLVFDEWILEINAVIKEYGFIMNNIYKNIDDGLSRLKVADDKMISLANEKISQLKAKTFRPINLGSNETLLKQVLQLLWNFITTIFGSSDLSRVSKLVRECHGVFAPREGFVATENPATLLATPT